MPEILPQIRKMKVAIVHDWITGMRGGERVLEAIAELFPNAELFTLLYVPGKASPPILVLKRHTSLLQRLPRARDRYRYCLPLMPWLIGRFDLSGFDLVISSSHCVAKGISKPRGAIHISYVHAPMRYMWDRYDDYFGKKRASPVTRLAAHLFRKRLQAWDKRTSAPDRIDSLMANSRFIAGQIQSHYAREAEVVYPFVDLSRFGRQRRPGGSYLMVGAMAPYKRVDLAIEAFNRMQKRLLVVGSGQDARRLKTIAGPTVEILGQLSNDAIEDLYSKCKALIFPGVEDFGITPLEAMAAGMPVIAYGEGGVLETVTEKTGLFFDAQTPESLAEAVKTFEAQAATFKEEDCRKRAAEFSKERFQQAFMNHVNRTLTAR